MDDRMDLDSGDDLPQAGPSNLSFLPQHPEASTSAMTIPSVFTPPSPFPIKTPPFSAAQDLLGLFQLQAAYDKYVKPYAIPVDQWQALPAQISDKAKGKERDPGELDVTMDGGSPQEGSGLLDDSTKDSKKRKKEGTYKHLIKSIPGKHSMKKDTYLVDMISVPPKQKVQIKTFDDRTQNDAFWVSLEGLKGYNIHALIPETDQAREDRKRRKKAEKAEKARIASLSSDPSAIPEQGLQAVVQVPTPMTNGAPTPAANASFIAVAGTSNGLDTKRDRMTNHPPNPAQLIPQRANGKISTPTTQRPSTPVNRQAGAQNSQRPKTPLQQTQRPQQTIQQLQRPQITPVQSRVNLSALSTQGLSTEVTPRGVKRERPETPLAQHHPNGHSHSSQVYPNHHGMVGHPAAAKKRRLESTAAVR